MSDGSVKILEMMYNSDMGKDEAMEILNILEEELRCLDSYERRGTFQEKTIKKVFDMNTHKYKWRLILHTKTTRSRRTECRFT